MFENNSNQVVALDMLRVNQEIVVGQKMSAVALLVGNERLAMCTPLLSTPVNEQLLGRLSTSVFQRGKVDVSLSLFLASTVKLQRISRKRKTKKWRKIIMISLHLLLLVLSLGRHSHAEETEVGQRKRIIKNTDNTHFEITLDATMIRFIK